MRIGFYGTAGVKKRALLRMLDTHLDGTDSDDVEFHFLVDAVSWTESLDEVFDYALDQKITMVAHVLEGYEYPEEIQQLVEDFKTEGAALETNQDPQASFLAGIDQLIALYDEDNDPTCELVEDALEADIPSFDLGFGLRKLELEAEDLPEAASPLDLLREQVEEHLKEDPEEAAAWLADQDRDQLKELADTLSVEYADRARSTSIAKSVVEALDPTTVEEAPEEEPEPAPVPEEAPEVVEVALKVEVEEDTPLVIIDASELDEPEFSYGSRINLQVTVEFGSLLTALGGDIETAIKVVKRLHEEL